MTIIVNFFDFKFVLVSVSDFNFIKVKGKGAFGKVWEVENKETKKKYALKVFSKLNIIESKVYDFIINEKNILSNLENK